MTAELSTIRIGILGDDVATSKQNRNVQLWDIGYDGVLAAAGAEPVILKTPTSAQGWDDMLEQVQGVVFPGNTLGPRPMASEETFCLWCREHKLPLLAIDTGMLVMNAAYGGFNYQDLSKEVPEALQHRHPPEDGIRHAINVYPNTLTAAIYGEGEIVVNSEHRKAIQKLARGFRVGAQALDGVIEAIESEIVGWFCMGVQWQPASPSASGLDIQVFRALVDHCANRTIRQPKSTRKSRRMLAAAS